MKISFLRPIAYLICLYIILVPIENTVGFIQGATVSKYIGIIIILMVAFYGLRNKNMKLKYEYNLYIFCMILYIFTLIWSIAPISTFLALKRYINMTIFFYAIVNLTYTEKEYTYFKVAAVLSGIVVVVLMIMGSITSLGVRISVNIGDGRVDPNELSVAMVLPILCALQFFIETKPNKPIKKITLFICLILMIYAVLLTGSRGGLIAVAIGIVFFIFFGEYKMSRKVKNIIIATLLIFAIVVIAINYLPQELLQRYTIEYAVEDKGAGRFTLWENAIQIYKESSIFRTIFGFGFGTFNDVYNSFFGIFKASHNNYLQVLMDCGGVGILIYAFFLWKTYKIGRKNRNYLGVAAFVGCMVGGMSLIIISAKMFWLSIFFCAIRIKDNNEEEKENVEKVYKEIER